MKIGKESEKLEFKKTTAELSDGIISMVAMLNKHGGGELYFGIRNDGTPLGMDISDKTLRDVSQSMANHIEPKVYPKINEVYVSDNPCIHVEFTGDDAPYLAFGRAYIRVADEDRAMSAAELENYILKKNAGRDAWDSDISGKTTGDVDEIVLRDYVDRANRAGRIDFPYTNNDEVLNRLGVTESGKLKNAADALFCGSLNLEVQMAIFAGTERLTFNDIARKSGSVTELVEIAEKYIRNNIRWRVVLDGSIQRKEIPEIPIEAIREAIINSYCHRLYTASQNNEITIYSNRVEIYNPGTFPEGLTPQDFIDGKERSKKRNPLLAQLMYYSKDIESFGTGLKRITETCKTAGVKVEFELLKLGFAVVFYRPDEHFDTYTDTPVGTNVGVNIGVNETQQRMLKFLKSNPQLTAEQLGEMLGITKRRTESNLKTLKDKNLIKRVGATKNGYWEIVANNDVAVTDYE